MYRISNNIRISNIIRIRIRILMTILRIKTTYFMERALLRMVHGRVNMAPKKQKNARRWTETELDCLADVLADPENNYAISLDKLALKKSSNNEVFEHIKIDFVKEMENEDFRARNAEHFKGKPPKLDVSIERLRQKYKWLKTEWGKHTRRAKNGSGLEPEKEPRWYQILNPVCRD